MPAARPMITAGQFEQPTMVVQEGSEGAAAGSRYSRRPSPPITTPRSATGSGGAGLGISPARGLFVLKKMRKNICARGVAARRQGYRLVIAMSKELKFTDEELTVLAIILDNRISARMLKSYALLETMRREGFIQVQGTRLVVTELGQAALTDLRSGRGDGATKQG